MRHWVFDPRAHASHLDWVRGKFDDSFCCVVYFLSKNKKLFSSIPISLSPVIDKGLFTCLSNGSSPWWVFLLATINYRRWIYGGEQHPNNYSFHLLIEQWSIYLSDGIAAVLRWRGFSPWWKSPDSGLGDTLRGIRNSFCYSVKKSVWWRWARYVLTSSGIQVTRWSECVCSHVPTVSERVLCAWVCALVRPSGLSDPVNCCLPAAFKKLWLAPPPHPALHPPPHCRSAFIIYPFKWEKNVCVDINDSTREREKKD